MSDSFDSIFDSPVSLDIKTEEKTVQLKEGERRTVAILFADIQGFTKLSEKLDHETVRDLLDGIFKIFTQSVEKHGGYVDKYAGDEIMALFGAKVASEVDTQRAVFCGLDILSKMLEINKQLPTKLNLSAKDAHLSIRVGVNTGVVTTGRVGKEREGDFTVYGDAVNTASRMESNAPPDRIMLSKATMELAGDTFNYEDHGSVLVKGKSDEISVFLVSGINERVSSDKKRFQTPYVGSTNALKKMKELLELSTGQINSDKDSQFITIGITGEAGLGKSRLVSEFLKRNQCDYIRSGASNIHSRPYYIFISLLKSCMDISEFDKKNDMELKLNDFYHSMKTTLLDSEYSEFQKSQALIGFLIGIDIEDDRLKTRGRELQTHIHISIRAFIKAICVKSNLSGVPLVIILEDMHWLDGSSMETIKYLYTTIDIDRGNNTEVSLEPFLILDYRPEFILPDVISQNSKMVEIIQEPLNEDNCLEIVNYFLDKSGKLPKDQLKLLLERSSGNPFFIEEWMQLLLLNTTDDIEDVTLEMDIPDSLNSLILSRVDHLDQGLKELLQKAAVLGVEFYLHLLQLIEKELGEKSDIQVMMDQLHDSKFVYTSNDKEYYHFKHILTREVTYETILKSNRKIIHGVAGNVIEDHFNERLENFYYDLATHFDLSGNIEKSIEYLEKAGQQAISIYDNSQAVVFYSRLIELLSDEKKQMDIKLKIGKIFALTGKWKDSEALLQNIYDKASKMNDKKRVAEFSGALGHSLYLQGDFKSARLYYEEQKDLSKEEEMPTEWAMSLGFIGNLEIDEGRLDIAMDCFEKQEKYYTESSMESELAPVYSNIATVYLRQGKVIDASDYYNKQLEICNKYDMKHERTKSLGNLAIINMIQGKFDDALYIFQEVLDVNHEIGDQQAIAKSMGNIGLAYNRLKNYESALDYYNKMLELSIRIGDQQSKANVYSSMGVVYKHQCKYDDAIESFKDNLKILEVLKISSALANTYGNMAETYMVMGDFSMAREYLDKTLVICRDQADIRIEAQVLRLLAEIDIMEGEFDSAKANIEKAYVVFEDINNISELYSLELMKVEIQRSEKEYNTAFESAKKCKEYAENIGDQNKIYFCSFLSEIIKYQSGELKDLNSIEGFKEDLPIEDDIRAIYNYELWKLSSGKKKNQYAEDSLNIYVSLNDKTPKYEYGQKIKELS